MWRSRISTFVSAAVTPRRHATRALGKLRATHTTAWATTGRSTSTSLSNQPHNRHHLHLRINISPHEEKSHLHSYHHRLGAPRRSSQTLRREWFEDRIFRQSSVKEVAGQEVRHDAIERAFYRQYNERMTRIAPCGADKTLRLL